MRVSSPLKPAALSQIALRRYRKSMPDDLRRSIEDLDAPSCPNCHLTMKWYRSLRISQSPLVIDHFFVCDNCGGVANRRSDHTDSSSDLSPPNKLSLPSGHRVAA
jgi:hypothetical protein